MSVPKKGIALLDIVMPDDVVTPGFRVAMSSEKLTSLIKIVVVVVAHIDKKTRTEVTG